MRGGDAIIKALMDKGVDTIFGYPGGTVIPFYDMLYDSDLRHILVRHEQCAAHAAEGYARASGKVGVCLQTWSLVLQMHIWIHLHLLQLPDRL